MESNNYALVRILFEAIINYFLLVRNKYAKQMEDHITLLHIIQLRRNHAARTSIQYKTSQCEHPYSFIYYSHEFELIG